jgi:hypothetical protein
MRALRLWTCLAALLLVCGGSDCLRSVPKITASRLLQPGLQPDSVVLDVFFVRVPAGDTAVHQDMWNEIDEQHLPPDVRQRLGQNGFRAGLVGLHVPTPLARLMELGEKAPVDAVKQQVEVTDKTTRPRVERHHMPLQASSGGQIVASTIHEQLTVLLRGADGVSGETFNQAQTIFGVQSLPLGDGSVQLSLSPEVHHGQTRQRWVGDQGILRLDSGKPKRVFDDMTVRATLAPGQMLVLSCLTDRPGSLGYNFFTERGESIEHRVLVVRLAQTQHHEMFGRSRPLALE